MNATDGSDRLHFSRLRRGKTPLEEQEGCVAKNEVCRKQHILLFAKMQIRFARRGHLPIPNFRDIRLPFAGQFMSAEPVLKIGMNTP
ncbi:hypothetical protein BSGG_5275 [Bacteroides sp. D2]|nr:hypothetical protein BSGG_5275 [Bacteroides sp. D2]